MNYRRSFNLPFGGHGIPWKRLKIGPLEYAKALTGTFIFSQIVVYKIYFKHSTHLDIIILLLLVKNVQYSIVLKFNCHLKGQCDTRLEWAECEIWLGIGPNYGVVPPAGFIRPNFF